MSVKVLSVNLFFHPLIYDFDCNKISIKFVQRHWHLSHSKWNNSINGLLSVHYGAKECPKAAMYGYLRAIFTTLEYCLRHSRAFFFRPSYSRCICFEQMMLEFDLFIDDSRCRWLSMKFVDRLLQALLLYLITTMRNMSAQLDKIR